MSAKLFYTVICAFAFGILIQALVPISVNVVAWGACIASVLLLVALRSPGYSSGRTALIVLSVGAIATTAGCARISIAERHIGTTVLATQVGFTVVIEGVVVSEPDIRERSSQFFLKTEDDKILIRTDRYANTAYGDVVRVEGVLQEPESFSTDLGRTFNYPGYLKAQGVIYLIPFATVTKLATGEGNQVIAHLLAVKHRFMRVIEKQIPDPQAGLGEGLLLGVKQALGDDLEAAFRKTGIIHIVVLSGYNVMLVVAFVLYVFAFLFGFRWRLILGLVAITAFALIVGLSATVVRASIMAGLLLTARLFGRTYDVLRGLCFAGTVMLILNPYLIAFDVGFQLSFVATLGLILLAPHLEARLQVVPGALGVREFLIATVATQIFVSPILLYQIGEFSVISVVVNVLVLPMVPVAMFLTFLTGLLGMISGLLATPVAWLAYFSLSYIIVICEGFASLPFAAYLVPSFPFWIVPVSYIFLGALLWYWYREGLSTGYGDIAERLIASDIRNVPTFVKNEMFDVSSWTIETEEELLQRTVKSKPRVTTKTPL